MGPVGKVGGNSEHNNKWFEYWIDWIEKKEKIVERASSHWPFGLGESAGSGTSHERNWEDNTKLRIDEEHYFKRVGLQRHPDFFKGSERRIQPKIFKEGKKVHWRKSEEPNYQKIWNPRREKDQQDGSEVGKDAIGRKRIQWEQKQEEKCEGFEEDVVREREEELWTQKGKCSKQQSRILSCELNEDKWRQMKIRRRNKVRDLKSWLLDCDTNIIFFCNKLWCLKVCNRDVNYLFLLKKKV